MTTREGITQENCSPLKALGTEQDIQKSKAWETPYFKELGVIETLKPLGVELVSPNA